MGNAAENEKCKMHATYWNNIGVGLFLAGAILPLLSLFSSNWMLSNPRPPIEYRTVFIIGAGILTAWTISLACHAIAQRALDKIQD
jgi:hypothetical protein